MSLYRTIVADPPWAYSNFQGKGKAFGDVSAHYSTMTPQEMAALPIQGLCDPSLCLLFMWATFPTLPDAMALIKAWGFEYKTVAFVWVKTRGDKLYSGLGFYTNSNAEICIVARRGKGPFVRANRDVKQIIQAPLGVHSQKPDEVMDRIVRLVGDVPRLEMFARKRRPGWDAFGNQVEGSITLKSVSS